MEIYKMEEMNVRYVKLVGYGNSEGSAWFNVSEAKFFN